MRRLLALLAATGLAAVAVLTANVAPASASGWTVSPGGAFTASASGAVFTNGNDQILCTSSVLTGTFQNSSSDGTGIGTVGSITFDNGADGSCAGPLGSSLTVVAAGPWIVDAETFDPATGVVRGTVTGVSEHSTWMFPIFGRCDFDVTGSLGVTYTNLTATLSLVSSDLTISNATGGGCGVEQVSDGQHPAWTGDYGMSPATIITSP